MPSSRFGVFKFGGSSLRDADRIRRAVDLVAREDPSLRHVVVASAMGGVTDLLLAAADAAFKREGDFRIIIGELRERHQVALSELALPDEVDAIRLDLGVQFDLIADLLEGIYLLRECTPRARDSIAGMGERLSVPIVAAAFRAAGLAAFEVDSARLVRTDDGFGEAAVDFETTNRLVQSFFAQAPEGEVAVVTGFRASTESGVTTTLGRSGSDYTATILAGALTAERIVIWTDVDGVLTADPRLVPEARPMPILHFAEAAELAYFGAKVLHPRTMRPLVERELPLLIKNTYNPDAVGTLVTTTAEPDGESVRAVTTIRDVAIVTLEGPGMVGVRGITARAFEAVAQRGINVYFATQASSEQSLTLVVRDDQAEGAVAALRQSFGGEIARGDVSNVGSRRRCAVVTAVGNGMRDETGVAGRLFAALGQVGVNVLAIGMSAAQNSLTTVVEETVVQKAVHAVHDAFRRDGPGAVQVALVGLGGVGSALLPMLARADVPLRLVAVSNSRTMRRDAIGLDASRRAEQLLRGGESADLDALVGWLADRPGRRVLVDCTASDAVPDRYEALLAAGVGIVTPNKRANTRDQDAFERLAGLSVRTPFEYETTVGAALPLVGTLRDVVASGDPVARIEGVFSGTLAFVLDRVTAGAAFSDAVREARALGFTEPDPRDDLSGLDVARKLLTLARVAGFRCELRDVAVDALYPDDWGALSVDSFFERLPELDGQWAGRRDALQAGERLTHVARLDATGSAPVLSVSVEAAAPDTAFGRLTGMDNALALTTRRYERPLVVSGPGAGHELTAAGVYADLTHAIRCLL
jgi:aspartokinase/homoserine dehydrogenase 1